MESVLRKTIEGYTHKDYNYTVDLSKFYSQIVTGEGYGELIVNYKPRESDQQKEQRVRITQNRTKSIAGKVEGFFKRVFRADKLAFDISHQEEEKSALISQYTDDYGEDGQSLLTWCEESALFYNNIDPNAFYWVQHTRVDDVDYFNPYVFTSTQVKDYNIDKGSVQYCTCQLSECVTYEKDETTHTKHINIFYYFIKSGLQLAWNWIKMCYKILTFMTSFKMKKGTF